MKNNPFNIKTFRDLLETAPPELRKRVMGLRFVPQNTDHHPEGNVLKHTILVVNNALPSGDVDMVLAALLHDVGKDVTFAIGERTGKPTAYGHDAVSAKLAVKYKDWITGLGGDFKVVEFLVKQHMRVKYIDRMRPFKRMSLLEHPLYEKLVAFSDMDNRGRYPRFSRNLFIKMNNAV